MRKIGRKTLILLLILGACAVLVFSIVSVHVRQSQVKAEMEQTQQMIENIKDENDKKQETINTGNFDEYAADIARKDLGYGEQDIKVYENMTGK